MLLRHGPGLDPYAKPSTIFAKTHDDADNDPNQGGLADAITAVARTSENAMQNPGSTIAAGMFAHENHIDPVLVANTLDWLRMRYETRMHLVGETGRVMAAQNV